MENVIYKISNNINSRFYIGSAKNFNYRKATHKSNLLKNKHHNKPMQAHVNKYGFETLIFEIIENCNIENLIEREQFYIDTLNPYFNTRRIAESNIGIKWTEEQKTNARISRSKRVNPLKGRKRSKETCIKIGLAHKGKRLSDKQKKDHSIKMKGRRVSEEVKKKISESTKGKVFSTETKQKLSKQKMGKLNPMFGKTKEKHPKYGKKYKQKNSKSPRKVIDTNTGIIYNSAKEGSEKLNIPFGTFSKYIIGYNKKITNFKYYENNN